VLKFVVLPALKFITTPRMAISNVSNALFILV